MRRWMWCVLWVCAGCGVDVGVESEPWFLEGGSPERSQEDPTPELSETADPTTAAPARCEGHSVEIDWYLEGALDDDGPWSSRRQEARWVLELEPIRTREAPHAQLLLEELESDPRVEVIHDPHRLIQGHLVSMPSAQVGDILGGLCHAQRASLTGVWCDGERGACPTSCPELTRGWPIQPDGEIFFDDSVLAGCIEDQGCGDLPTGATDPSGHEWYFGDTCTPVSWSSDP